MKKTIISDSKILLLDIEEITDFYNDGFPNSRHELRYKKYIYSKPEFKTIVVLVKIDNEIVGLLESWYTPKNQEKRLLVTLLVSKKHQDSGLAKEMMNKLFELTKRELLRVNFRESKKDKLISFYKKFGFKTPVIVGKYVNGENMWEMEKG